MCRAVYCAVRAAGQCRARRFGKGRAIFPDNVVVVHEVCRLCNAGLRIDQRRAEVQADVKLLRCVYVRADHDLEVVAASAAALCRGVGVRRLCTRAGQLVGVQRAYLVHHLTQTLELVMGERVAENGEAVLLEIRRRYLEHRVIRAPVQFERHSCNAAVTEVGACLARRHEIDVAAGQHLVLRGKNTAAKCHIRSPFLSCIC